MPEFPPVNGLAPTSDEGGTNRGHPSSLGAAGEWRLQRRRRSAEGWTETETEKSVARGHPLAVIRLMIGSITGVS
jgi:hypothetical protein